MNISGITRRIEISFWTLAVRIMEEPKKLRIALLSLVAIISLSFGYLMFNTVQVVGKNWDDRQTQPVFVGAEKTAEQTKWATDEPMKQRKILVMVVKNLSEKKARLVSVWFATYVPSRSQATMFPLYPASLSGGAADDQAMVDAFQLRPDGKPDQAFLELLRSKNITWDNFLLLDEFGLAELIDMTGGMDLGQGPMDGMQTLAQIPGSTAEPKAAFFAHATLAQGLCLSSNDLIQKMEVADVTRRLASHMLTDLTEKNIAEEWRRLRPTNTGISCEFPNLAELFQMP